MKYGRREVLKIMNQIKMENLSKKTGIPLVEIKAALGNLPKFFATTAAGAKRAHQLAVSLEDLMATLIKWREFSLIEANSAKNADQARKAIEDALPGSEGERLAFTKLNDFCLEKINTADTVSEIKIALLHALPKSKAMEVGISKIVSLSNDINELMGIYKETLVNSNERILVVAKIINLSSSR